NGSDILLLVDVSRIAHVFAAGDVNATDDEFTIVGHGFSDDDTVQISTDDTLPAHLVAGTTYHVINTTSDTIELSESQGGEAVNITDTGTGPHTVTRTGPENIRPVASQRDVTFDENTAEINMSSKDTRAAKVDAGRYSASCTLESLYVP